MTGIFLLAYGLLVVGLILFAAGITLFLAVYSQLAGVYLAFMGLVSVAFGIMAYHDAVYTETTCSTQGLHTIGGKCVKVDEVGVEND